jgi:HlyD family secretion protein
MKKKTKIAILTIVVVGVGLTAFNAMRSKAPKAVDVQTEVVARQDVVATISASGQIQPRVRVNLSSDVSGRIVSLDVVEGQLVTKGQVLLRIDSAQFQAAYERAEASLASVNAQAAQTQENNRQMMRNLQRTEEMARQSSSAVTTEALEQLRAQAKVSAIQADAVRFSVQQAEAGLRDAKNNLAKTVIVAPMSGRVTRVSVREGETAIVGNLNKDAAALLTISDMSVLETRIRVDETEVTRISIGDSADVQIDAFPDTTFRGQVSAVSNSSTRAPGAQPSATQAVDFEVTIRLIDPPSQTRPDFSATAKVITAIRKNAVAIPIGALTIRDNPEPATEETPGDTVKGGKKPKRDQEGVFVIGPEGTALFRVVKIGITGETHFEVLDGLREGDVIVTGPFQAIRDLKEGALVRARPRNGPVR